MCNVDTGGREGAFLERFQEKKNLELEKVLDSPFIFLPGAAWSWGTSLLKNALRTLVLSDG